MGEGVYNIRGRNQVYNELIQEVNIPTSSEGSGKKLRSSRSNFLSLMVLTQITQLLMNAAASTDPAVALTRFFFLHEQ